MGPTSQQFPPPSRDDGTDPRQGDFARLVRDALRHLHDPLSLQTHPLAGPLMGPDDTASTAGKRLGRALRDAITVLQPWPGSRDTRFCR